jgi:hypothetical protein
VFSNTARIASVIAPSFSASRISLRRSTSVNPFGAKSCLATSVRCSAGFLVMRSVSAAQLKKLRSAASAALTDAGFCRFASSALHWRGRGFGDASQALHAR